jgi:tRNA-dihydrouridine synthase
MKTWKNLSIVATVLAIAALGSPSLGSAEEEKSVTQLIAEAKTPADHREIAALYLEKSAKFQRESGQHSELAKWWASLVGGQSPGNYRYVQADHCRRFANLLEEAALEAQALAKEHENIAHSVAEDQQ